MREQTKGIKDEEHFMRRSYCVLGNKRFDALPPRWNESDQRGNSVENTS